MKDIDINAKYGLPDEVKFCARCVMSNQRPNIIFDENGVCSACHYVEYKKNIDWKSREDELIELLDKHRSKDGSFDCVVPSSGGKDSAYVAHELKDKYGMHPLTVTWAPLVYTEIGWKNIQAFNHSGFDIIMGMAKGDISKRLCKDATIEMGDPFQPFIYGQVLFPIKIASKFGIKLIFSGENAQAEYGGKKETWDKKGLDVKEYDKVWFSKLPYNSWLEKGYSPNDLEMLIDKNILKYDTEGIKRYFYGYFKSWSNHENYYYAKKHTNFIPNPERTEGTYTRYSSIDDEIDPFHHWFGLIKFGVGRCTANAAREVREGYRERHEAAALVQRYDTEFPSKSFPAFLDYTGLSEDEFWKIADSWRNKKIWIKDGNDWKLKYQVS